MTCQTCGRDDGHWLNCPDAPGVRAETPPPRAQGASEAGECEFPGCSEPKASASPRAKWCEEHKDKKNREK